MLKKISYLIILTFLYACAREEVSIPDNILPQEKMVQVLTDIHIAEVTANYKSLADTNKADIKSLYSHVYKEHSITAEEYKRSYQFYLDHPTLLNKLYDEVITELSRRQTEIQNN